MIREYCSNLHVKRLKAQNWRTKNGSSAHKHETRSRTLTCNKGDNKQ